MQGSAFSQNQKQNVENGAELSSFRQFCFLNFTACRPLVFCLLQLIDCLTLFANKSLKTYASQIYFLEFSKHVSSDQISYDDLLAELLSSKLSDSVKSHLPSSERLRTTVRNINWMHSYWQAHNEVVPAPLDGSCGFAKSKTGAGVAFADEAL